MSGFSVPLSALTNKRNTASRYASLFRCFCYTIIAIYEFAVFRINIYSLKMLPFVYFLLAVTIVHVIHRSTPFKVFNPIIIANLILVVYLWEIVWIWNKSLCNESMH